MAKEPTLAEIDGRTYIIGDWDVDRSLKMLVWLTKTFGEGVLRLFIDENAVSAIDRLMGNEDPVIVDDSDDDSEGKIETPSGPRYSNEEKASIQDFVGTVLSKIEPDDYPVYVREIIRGVKVGGANVQIESFQAKIGALHELVFAVLKHQYSDFLEGGGVADS